MGIEMTCSIFKSSAHNKRSCPSRPTSPTITSECNVSQQSSTGSTRKRSVIDTQEGSTNREGIKGSRTKYKRPKVKGQGVFVSKTGYSCVNKLQVILDISPASLWSGKESKLLLKENSKYKVLYTESKQDQRLLKFKQDHKRKLLLRR